MTSRSSLWPLSRHRFARHPLPWRGEGMFLSVASHPHLYPPNHTPQKNHPIPPNTSHSRCPTQPNPLIPQPSLKRRTASHDAHARPGTRAHMVWTSGQKWRFSASPYVTFNFRVTGNLQFCRGPRSRPFGVFRPRQSVKGICPS